MAIKDEEKITEFMSLSKQVYRKKQQRSELDQLLRQHYSMTEISSDHDTEVCQKNQLLYDVMKSKISKGVHSVKSHHMAVGELCINMLVGISKQDGEAPNHHTM